MAFNLPVQNYFSRTTGPAEYSRPSDWPVITDVATEVQFLFCDLGDSACSINTTFTRTSGSQNIVIDWGDGTTNTVTTATQTVTNHTYTPGSGTVCSLGYTTFKIRVYFTGIGVSVLSNCNILSIGVNGVFSSFTNCAVLEAYYGNSTQNATPVNFNSQGASTSTISFYQTLQFVKLPATVTWTSWDSAFYNCVSLVKVIMPTSNSANTSLNNTFNGCANLLECTIPSNSTAISTLSQTFFGCNNLRSVTLPTTLNSCNNVSQTFWECANLRSITLPSLNACTNFQYAFINCKQLEWVKFTSLPTVASTISFQSTFTSCSNLQNVYFPATGNAGSTYNFNSTFSNCPQLKSIILPSNVNVSSFTNTFNSCSALTSCILPTSAAACTDYGSMFTSCFALLKITLPTAPTANVSFINTFNNCSKLEEITIPSGYKFTSMAGTFTNCHSLKTLTWTPGIQNSLTTCNSTFINCYILTSITMPTSMTALIDLVQTFYGCFMLKRVDLPSTLNSVTSLSNTFAFCKSLTLVTLPTSMSACTNFSTTFSGCRSIFSITLPNIVGNVTTFSATFENCSSLKTCVLPGAAQLSFVTDISTMFSRCSNLVTLTNFDKIGSLTATPLMNATNMLYNRFTGGSAISFSGPLSGLNLSGLNGFNTNVQSVRLTNASAGQWLSSSTPINISYTMMSTAQIVQLFTDLAAGPAVSGRTINITLATGAAGLTLANRQIVTNKGWTITG